MATLMDDLTAAFSIGAPVLFVCALSCLWTSMRAAHADERRLAREAARATFDAYLLSFRESPGGAEHFPELAEYLRDNPATALEAAKKPVMDAVLRGVCRALAAADPARDVSAVVRAGRLYVMVVAGAGQAQYADPGVYLAPGAPVVFFSELPDEAPPRSVCAMLRNAPSRV